jgi:AraC-like DNA-binding protein
VALRIELVNALRGADDGQRLSSSVTHSAALCAQTLALVEAVREGHALSAQESRTEQLFRSLAPLWTRAAPRPEPALVRRARRTLTESPGTVLSLDDLGRRLGCAPSYLCRIFSEHTGVGPRAYQLQQRVLEAARLIESGSTVATAAAVTGFGDESHLRRHFHRRFAVAPGRYQKAFAPTQTRRP